MKGSSIGVSNGLDPYQNPRSVWSKLLAQVAASKERVECNQTFYLIANAVIYDLETLAIM